MVIAAILALLLGGGAPASQGCTTATEFEPSVCPTRLPRIRGVVITTNGATAWADRDERVPCARFRLGASQVRSYLAKAGQVDARAAHYSLDESPCHATGTVRFADGSRGAWRIDRYRKGRLVRAGKPDMILYCPRCRTRPFSW